ncbi:hypothetical protein LTR66_003470 [Elasticomyces elasticus]|nr:hypothetical protein LTR66_003470 [Elasticomyces elasticus]
MPYTHTRISRRAQTRWLRSQEDVTVHSVKFQKPPFWTTKRLATFALYNSAFLAYWYYVLPSVDIEIDEEEAAKAEEELKNKTDAELDQEESLFIPMTWATKMPKTFYKGSDPEWQMFLKIAQDKKKLAEMRTQLTDIVFQGATSHPALAIHLGKDAAIGKHWLDHTFPDGPPQEHVRSGVEVGETFIAWTSKPVPPETQQRLDRALWPTAAFNSLYATTRVMARMQWQKMKEMIGMGGDGKGSPEEQYRHALQMIQAQQQRRQGVGRTQTNTGASSTTETTTTGAPDASSSPKPSISPSKSNSNAIPWLIKPPIPSTSDSSVPIALHVFTHTLSRNWSPAQTKTEPPRGCVVVSGLVEIRGERSRCLFDVTGFWDPQKNKYEHVTASLRNLKRHRQRPKGGA